MARVSDLRPGIPLLVMACPEFAVSGDGEGPGRLVLLCWGRLLMDSG